MINATLVDPKDNVAVAIEPIAKGDDVVFSEDVAPFKALEDIPIFHKVAVAAIPKGAKICKYGEHIGEARVDIARGAYVHVHNLGEVREHLVG